MNIHIVVTIILALPAVTGQFNGRNSLYDIICELIQRCKPTSPYCSSANIKRLQDAYGCKNVQTAAPTRPVVTRPPPTTTTTTTTTTRRPTFDNRCGIGGMGNARLWINSLPRIVGGDDSPSGYFPWQVKVRPGGGHCGGTLVSSDTIVTAAHCMVNYENRPSAVQISYGSINTNTAETVTASEVIVHPEYYRSSQPDIAIIKLARSIRTTATVRPACLPSENRQLRAGDRAIVSGWGILAEGTSRIPNIMQYVAVPIIDRQRCNQNYGGGIQVGEVCAGYSQGGRDACQGDSGGALVMPNSSGDRWELIGVVSRGSGCARPSLPGIYARVPNYVSWIRRFL